MCGGVRRMSDFLIEIGNWVGVLGLIFVWHFVSCGRAVYGCLGRILRLLLINWARTIMVQRHWNQCESSFSLLFALSTIYFLCWRVFIIAIGILFILLFDSLWYAARSNQFRILAHSLQRERIQIFESCRSRSCIARTRSRRRIIIVFPRLGLRLRLLLWCCLCLSLCLQLLLHLRRWASWIIVHVHGHVLCVTCTISILGRILL